MNEKLIRVLLVEDDEDDYFIFKEMLSEIRRYRFDLEWAPSFSDALKAAKKKHHHIYLVDYYLGDRHGLELLHELQALGRRSPIIVLTGQGDRDVDIQAMKEGAADYLEKSRISSELLERSIRYALERAKTLDALRHSEAQFRGIFLGAGIGIALLDSERRILESNPALRDMLGFEAEELLHRDFISLVHPDNRDKVIGLYRDLESGNRPASQIEERFLQKGGAPIWGCLTVSFFQGEDLSSRYAISMLENSTRRKLAEDGLRESEKKLRILSAKLLAAQEAERKLVALELHDSIGGSLAAIKYSIEEKLNNVGSLERGASLKDVIVLIQKAIEETRRISTHLRPSILDDLGIMATINWHCRELRNIYSSLRIEKQLKVQEDDIPRHLKIVIYRILQEALNNVVKHSRADRVRILLSKGNGYIEFSVADNGSGFDPSEASAGESAGGGMGLSGMRERTELSGGKFSIESGNREGTTLKALWPGES